LPISENSQSQVRQPPTALCSSTEIQDHKAYPYYGRVAKELQLQYKTEQYLRAIQLPVRHRTNNQRGRHDLSDSYQSRPPVQLPSVRQQNPGYDFQIRIRYEKYVGQPFNLWIIIFNNEKLFKKKKIKDLYIDLHYQ
jgi:hypothetical protein